MKSVFIASVVIMLLLLPLTVWLLYPVYNNKFEAKIENHMIMEVGSSVR